MSLSPIKILKLWGRANDRFGPGEADEEENSGGRDKKKKSPNPKVKAAEVDNKRIGKGLTRLRKVAQGNMADSSARTRFVSTRDKTVKSMKRYCKALKGDSLKEEMEDLSKFRKAVKALTQAVALLAPMLYPEEPGEPDLSALEKIDTGALDKEMLDPKFGEFSAAELAELDKDDDPEIPTPAATTPASGETDQAKYERRNKELQPILLKTLQEQRGDTSRMRSVSGFASEKAGAEDYAKALTALDQLQKLLEAAGSAVPKAEAPAAPAKPPQTPLPDHRVTRRFRALEPHYDQALALKGDDVSRMRMLYLSVEGLLKNKDFVQGELVLDELEPLVYKAIGGKPAPPEPDPLDKFTARLKELKPDAQRAMASGTELGQDVKLGISEANVFARKRDFDQAHAMLDRVEKLLEELPPEAEDKEDDNRSEAEKSDAEANGAAGEFANRLKNITKQALDARKTNPDLGKELKLLLSEAQTFDRKKDFTQGNAVLDRAERLLQGQAGNAVKTEAEGEETEADESATPLEAWQVMVDKIVKQLRSLAGEVKNSEHPEATKALIEISAVLKQLTRNPATQEQVKNLQRYLKEDEVVADVCDLAFDFRTPLLKILAKLEPQAVA